MRSILGGAAHPAWGVHAYAGGVVQLRESPADTPDARALLTEYFHSRELGFAHQAITYTTTFPDPAVFTPPQGVFLIVEDDEGTAVGCGGIRRIEDGPTGIRYEVKHLFLRPETRGRGWGHLLMQGLEDRARAWDATELVLDTHHSLEAAAALYARSGFTAIEPYNGNPNATRWYGKALA
jgi:GNAT superfamily N-acetyltransferase